MHPLFLAGSIRGTPLMTATPPPPPTPRLSVAVTGHRPTNACFAAHEQSVAETLDTIFGRIDASVAAAGGQLAPTRLHSLLAAGVDQIAAGAAIERGWELVAPLPFGRRLNRAINAAPITAADAHAILDGRIPADPAVAARMKMILAHEERARLFEIVDQDEPATAALLATLDSPGDGAAARLFNSLCSTQVALAGTVMIEQSDLVIGVWDGKAPTLLGGTGQTIAAALALGVPVLLIDPAYAANWTIVTTAEELGSPARAGQRDDERLERLVHAALRPDPASARNGAVTLGSEQWHNRSSRLWLGYRLVEHMFGNGKLWPGRLVRRFEAPDGIAGGSGATVVAAGASLPSGDAALIDNVARNVLPDFAWADGISTWLSDAYRSGMVANFALATLAVLIGLAYQPLGFADAKWMFATVEFVLLLMIVGLTAYAKRRRWHERWFDTRRVAEYLRHAPLLLLLGVGRPASRWPQGKGSAWPEYHARHRLRETGLPRVALTQSYLKAALERLLLPHVIGQREYHRDKARRLSKVHHRLDRLSIRLFIAAVVAVACYLALEGLAQAGQVPNDAPYKLSKLFTFLGVAFPLLGANISAVRFFGDFERFGAISDVAAAKLDALAVRIETLLSQGEAGMNYATVAGLARAVEETTIAEIESWQAVFGGKHVALPA